MLTTRFTELLGCSVPIQLAGMGGVSTVPLAAAVAEAGAVGMVAAPVPTPGAVAALLDEAAGLTSGVVGVNFLVPFFDPACLEEVGLARLVELFYGEPDAAVVSRIRASGARAAWQVGSRDEAVAAVDAGCDLVIAQGVEAGGHVRGRLPLMALLEQVLGAIDVPVVAAGGIATAEAVAAVLAAGADAARVGTRFVAAAESGAHPRYVELLIEAGAGDTVLTEEFSLGWPGAPHRVLRSSLERALASPSDTVATTTMAGQPVPVPRLSPIPPTRETEGDIEAMALYAGESVGKLRQVAPAAAIVRELAEGAERILAGESPDLRPGEPLRRP